MAFAPADAPYLYAEGTHSPVDPLRPFAEQVAKYPKYGRATPYVVIVEEGETLFVPRGWWHYALSLEPTVTVMRNFWTETNADSYREMAGDQFRKKLQMLQKQGVLRKDLPDFSETDPGVEEAKDGGVVAG